MGEYGPAQDVTTHALNNGRDVVAANKELMANESEKLEELTHRNGLLLMCSASVVGEFQQSRALNGFHKVLL